MEWLRDFLRPEFIWALVGLVLLLLEFIAPGLIIFFFGLGAWVVALACLFWNINVNIQLIIFLVSSVVLLFVLRKFLKGLFMGHVYSKQPDGEDLKEYLGLKVMVTETITPPRAGKVEVNGVEWKAVSDSEIAVGKLVEVLGRDNLTLTVKTI